MKPLTPKYWDDPAADNLDRVVEMLAHETKSSGLRGKLIEWGWQSPSGESLTWWHWWLKRERKWI